MMNNHKHPNLGKGINNRHRDYLTNQPTRQDSSVSVLDAVNVEFCVGGSVRQRVGFSQHTPLVQGHSVKTVGGRMFLAFGGNLHYVESTDPLDTNLVAPVSAPVSYAGQDGAVWWSDGVSIGRVNADGSSSPVAVPTPASVALADGVGGLYPGFYRVALTYTNASGEESAACTIVETELTLATGILLTLPTAPAGVVSTNVYCTHLNGGELFLYASVAAATVVMTISSEPTGRAIGDLVEMLALPAGDILVLHGARLVSAKGKVLSYSEAYRFGLYKPAKNFVTFPEEITNVLSTPQGLYVAAGKTYFMAGYEIPETSLVDILPFGGVHGTEFSLPNQNMFGWLATEGVFLAGNEGGSIVTGEGFKPPTAQHGSAFVHTRLGERFVVFMLDNSAVYDGVTKEFSTSIQRYGDDATALCLNAVTWAPSRFTNWYFDSVAAYDGVVYGVDDEGLHILGAASDNGKPVIPAIEFGRTDFGTDRRKRLTEFYLYAETSSPLLLTVRGEDGEYTYTADKPTEYMGPQRAVVGKGLRGTWYEVCVSGDGAVFEMAAISNNLSASNRRIR